MDGALLNSLVSLGNVVNLQPPWAFLSPSADVRQFSGNRIDTVQTLEAAADAEDLQSARIVVKDAAGRLSLCPVLSDGTFIVARREKDGPPIDLESARGRLINSEPPALHCTEDYATRTRAAKHNFVLAAFSDADLALLRILRLPVTSAFGLSKLSADQARRLLLPKQSLDVLTQAEAPGRVSEKRPKLILVGVELFQIKNQMPAGVLNAARQFQRVDRALKLNTASNVGIWLPSAADFRSICDGVQLSDQQLVRSAITNSVQRSTESISDYFKSTSGRPANDVQWARKKLLEAINTLPESRFGTRDVVARFDDLNRAYDIAIVEGINHDAMAAADPLVKALLTIAADLMSMHCEWCELAQRATAAIETGNAAIVDICLEDRLRVQSRLAGEIIRIKKAIEKPS